MAFGLVVLVLIRQGLILFELLANRRDTQAGLMQRFAQATLGGGTEGQATGYDR
jgi:hypothetical protein